MTSPAARLRIPRDLLTSEAFATSREWLVANGIGGYASGTLGRLATRRYHGLLVAALRPPLGRTVLVSHLEPTATYAGSTYYLFTNQWRHADVRLDPHGFIHHLDFSLEGTTPVWVHALRDARLEERIWMQPGANTTYVRYTLLEAHAPVQLSFKTFVNYRDFHATTRAGGWQMSVEPVESGVKVVAFEGAAPIFVFAPDAEIETQHTWYRDHFLRAEHARGLDALDDNLCVAGVGITLSPGEGLTIIASTDSAPNLDGRSALEERLQYESRVEAEAGLADAPVWIRHLALAADQFLVSRPVPGEEEGRSIVAGYPWFGDWGRDTMISLAGLTLATGRPAEARRILRTFSRFVDKGMLPNRFPDNDGPAEYNTVDASLWYFEAIQAYLDGTGDQDFLRELIPVLQDMIDWHVRGTRYGIRQDPDDGLLYAGEAGVQLTWMDAKVGDWVVTPRIGKPVEVNALWYNALRILADLATAAGKDGQVYQAMADRVKASFDRFWNGSVGYCFDVLDGPEGHDPALRPNQLFAVSLTHSPLSSEQQRRVVEVCQRDLLTPLGLSSLAPGEPGYIGSYVGGPAERDGAYHQGTVWTWLIGPFVAAHLRVYGRPEKAMSFLLPFADHLTEFCVGTVAEIAEGDPPHAPRGAVAQAWSVAEILRVWRLTSGSVHL